MHATVRLEHALLAVERPHHVHAMLELAAPEPPSERERPELGLALVLDRSGSMAGEKLEAARGCAAWLVRRLAHGDELALVAYDHEVSVLAPRGPVDAATLERRLAGLFSGGQTNLSGGWLAAREQLAGASGARTILLLSDGLANVGICAPPTLAGLTAGAAREGITTSTIGLGDDFDEDLLTAMADAGGGNAHWAASPDAAPAIFAKELAGLTTLVAQNVTVEIRPHAAVEMLGILNGYPTEPVPGGVLLRLGDAYGGERRRLVFELAIPYLAALGPVPVAELVVRYVAVGDAVEQRTLRVALVANAVSAAEAAASAGDPIVREEVLVLTAARARDEAVRLADQGHHRAARAALETTARDIRRAAESGAVPPPMLLEAEALEQAGVRMDADLYAASPAERKALRYASQERRRRRGMP